MKLAIALVIFFSSPLLAQWQVGGKSGITFSDYETNVTWTKAPKTGFFAGVAVLKELNPNLSFGADVLYIQKGYFHKICNTIYDKLEANYLELPLRLDYGFNLPGDFKACVNVGLYAALWLNGRYLMAGFDQSSEPLQLAGHNRFDFGPNAGLAIRYRMPQGQLIVEARYAQGVVDMRGDPQDQLKNINRCLSIGLGYFRRL